jgi:hypothetical protein
LTTLNGEVLTDPDLAHSDVFRPVLQAGLQDRINAEATARIGAALHERTPERTTRRNITRPKTPVTQPERSTLRRRTNRSSCISAVALPVDDAVHLTIPSERPILASDAQRTSMSSDRWIV